jgi:lipid-binding SYLF domain-containing protein
MTICRHRAARPAALLATAGLFFCLIHVEGSPVPARERLEAEKLVQEATLVFQGFMCDEHLGSFRDLVRDAKGVMIIPSWLAEASSYANAVLLRRDRVDGDWRGPAFYTTGGALFDPALEGRPLEVILLIVTERGVERFKDDGFKVGGGVKSGTVPLRIDGSEARAQFREDILVFSRCKGLYGGIVLDGTAVAVRPSLNITYYAENLSPEGIFEKHAFDKPLSAILAGSVAKAANQRNVQRECAGLPVSERAGGMGAGTGAGEP